PVITEAIIGGTTAVFTACLLTFTISIAVGSLLAALASKTRPNLAVVPIGALVMGLALIHLAWGLAHTTKASPP
ncbi:hypothetical protein, partial [Brucella anthropi]|uniref:hypothetical protein n=1 Tax=Brucella anthropi TaxID=529 RepID=UPI002362AD6A